VSITTWTLTDPVARTARAAGGYGGFGKDIAFPLRTPPEMVFGIDPGLEFERFEFGAGGG
jgi:hypothetical protein